VNASEMSDSTAVSLHVLRGGALAVLLALVLGMARAAADGAMPSPTPMAAGGHLNVARVIDGDTVALDDGRVLRLAGIMAPKAAEAPALHALAEAARDAVAALAQGGLHQVTFFGRDRHDRLLAHAQADDGRWLQGELLAAGLARVATAPEQRAHAADMLRIEAAARAAGRGLWRHQRFRVLDVDEAGQFIGGFQLVEGTVLAVGRARGRIYLNFGSDWRTDFTVVVDQRSLDQLAGRADGERRAVGERLVGQRVRVRGWIKSFNGPLIEANHPEQIELIDR